MRPRGKPFDIKKTFKNSNSRCMALYDELILNPRKINVLKKLTLKLKEQKLKKLVPKDVKFFLDTEVEIDYNLCIRGSQENSIYYHFHIPSKI